MEFAKKVFSGPRNVLFFLFLSFVTLSGCDRLATLPHIPKTTPETWLKTHPHINVSLGSFEFIFMEPTSTFFVYFLGFLGVGVGLYLLRIRENHKSRLWWGIALVLWGIQAILGGTAYQALSYELKCAGKEICSYISWVEIYYYLVSIAGINAMVIGVAHSSAGSKLKKALTVYAAINTVVYSALCLTGALIPGRFLVSFELIVLFTTPSYLILFIINAIRYQQLREKMDLALMITWLSLGVIMAAYYLFWGLGYAKKLWDRGIWFNENDVLHIGLIFWMIYIAVGVAKKIKDLNTAADFTIVSWETKTSR
ncbi:hypothetical protein KKI24_19830 [bacterium]|nr:hypothetical protein [bacterium]